MRLNLCQTMQFIFISANANCSVDYLRTLPTQTLHLHSINRNGIYTALTSCKGSERLRCECYYFQIPGNLTLKKKYVTKLCQMHFITSLLYKEMDFKACQSVFWELARQEEMTDGGWPLQMQPRRQHAHRAIVWPGLAFSLLCSITMSEAEIDSVWCGWQGTATQWVLHTYKYGLHWSRHWAVSNFILHYNVTARCSAAPVMCCRITNLIISESRGDVERAQYVH